ncbi:MAG: hypothetical protein V1681_09015 [Candidatus Neomarinimicrobiota bacterium]
MKKTLITNVRLAGIFLLLMGIELGLVQTSFAQKNYGGKPLFINVNAIKLDMKKVNGEGEFTTQYSWRLTDGDEQNEIFMYPQDEWHSRMLYQIFNPVCPDDDGFIDEKGQQKIIPETFVSNGKNDFSWEIRRYRPPNVVVDGVAQNQEYTWQVDPTLKSDIKAVWEDVIPFWGIRTHIEVTGFSNPNHDNYLIWKATYKFTGETKRAIETPDSNDFFPDQTMRLWWPLSFSFGPSKGGEYYSLGDYACEGEDDLDSWFGRPSNLVRNANRDSLKIAYYWDYKSPGVKVYSNGSSDDSGDPDRVTGHLIAPQIPGFALLHSAKNSFNLNDDNPSQPYAMPHATILDDLWLRRDFGLRDTYIGDDTRGKFPLDPIAEGWINENDKQKGPMRFITIGPYELTKNSQAGITDSICAVYAVGAGSISWEMAHSIGADWLSGVITDQQKDEYILTGKDSLFQAMDRANWAWHRGLDIPDPPPPPDVTVTSRADRIVVEWSYPNNAYFKDPDTGVDDWYSWRIYRKKGASYVNSPDDSYSGENWEMIYETTDRNETVYADSAVTRGVSYYYAVTALDDGTQNTDGLFPGQKLESSRYVNRTGLPAIPYKAGKERSDLVRVVPNPATIAAGTLGSPGEKDRILIANLPYKCKLQIFTETGDLIKTIHHIGTDQEIWHQRTDANQYIMSGIYILSVLEAEDATGKSLSDQFVKFIIVR